MLGDSAVTSIASKKPRLAVFTSQFPSRVCTFFARDMRGLLEAGMEIDVFPMYPEERGLWHYVPDILDGSILPRTKVHHIGLGECLRYMKLRPLTLASRKGSLRDVAAILGAAARVGIEPFAKNAYVLPKAWAWAQQYPDGYDHVLGYWGNYAATSAYLFHRLTGRRGPFTLFLHAGADLYHNQVFLKQKLLYADNIMLCCEFNREFIRQHFSDIFHLISDKIHVHHHGLDFAEYSYEPDRQLERRILAVGRFYKSKGFDYLLRAVHELRLRGFEAELELVGDGPEKDALRKLARNLGINNQVTFRGWLSPDQVRVAMRQATALVQPSTGLDDALPNVIKEAMALGTPVIASNLVGIPEALDGGRCGVLVPPMSVSALADALEGLLKDTDLRRKYAYAARKRAESKFDLWRNGGRLANLLCATRLVSRPHLAT